jgi:hypothetical protein
MAPVWMYCLNRFFLFPLTPTGHMVKRESTLRFKLFKWLSFD